MIPEVVMSEIHAPVPERHLDRRVVARAASLRRTLAFWVLAVAWLAVTIACAGR